MTNLSDLALSLEYPGVFLISLFASTLVPFSNEVVVMAMPSLGYEFWQIIIWATAGGFAGSLLNYFAAKREPNLLFALVQGQVGTLETGRSRL
jgi:membrane protein YqaA with SNARE-associated domain